MTQLVTATELTGRYSTVGFEMQDAKSSHWPETIDAEPIYEPDAIFALTPLSEMLIQQIHDQVRRLAGTSFRSAKVQWTREEGEHRLDLIVRVDSGRDEISRWEYAIQDKITELSKDWSNVDWTEYSQHIFHKLVPTRL